MCVVGNINAYTVEQERLRKRENLEDIRVAERITLILILNK